jgi:hypothetical protein
MKGIYLTKEGKKAIENKIAELEVKRDKAAEDNDEIYANSCIGQIFAYYEILSSATILPVEESWEDVELYPLDNELEVMLQVIMEVLV